MALRFPLYSTPKFLLTTKRSLLKISQAPYGKVNLFVIGILRHELNIYTIKGPSSYFVSRAKHGQRENEL